MPAYIVAQMEVHDIEMYREYAAAAETGTPRRRMRAQQ